MITKERLKWFLPIGLFILITPFTPNIDLYISSLFYHPNPYTRGTFTSNAFTQLFYRYGMIPAFILFAMSLITIVSSYYYPKLLKWRLPSIFFITTFAIGPGLIVHLLFKGFWGRPRPIQITKFGGFQHFIPYYAPNFGAQAKYLKSFPSGHCTMGFIFFALYFIGKRMGKRWLSYLGIFLTVSLGASLSYARIASGGHFFSDVLGAAIIIWYCALLFDWLFFCKFSHIFSTHPEKK